METGHHITSWYRMTPWDESVTDDGTLSIEIVNKYHQQAANMVRVYSKEECREKAEAILKNLPGDETFCQVEFIEKHQ